MAGPLVPANDIWSDTIAIAGFALCTRANAWRLTEGEIEKVGPAIIEGFTA